MTAELNNILEKARMNPAVGYERNRTTGFAENLSEAAALFMREDLSISGAFYGGTYRDIKMQLRDLRRNGDIAPDVWESYSEQKPWEYDAPSYDYEGLANYARNNLGVEIELPSEADTRIRDELKVKREEAEQVFAQSNLTGKVGQFVGTLGGAATDPVNYVFLGMGAAMVAGKGLSFLTRAALAAGENMATEIMIQPSVLGWKEKIDSPYGTKEAIINIAAAAGVGATFEGIATGVRKLVGRSRKLGLDKTEEGGASIRALDQFADEMERGATSGVDDPIEYASRIDQAAGAYEARGPAVVQEIEEVVRRYDEAPEQLDLDFDELRQRSTEMEMPTKVYADETGREVVEVRRVADIIDEIEVEEKALEALRGCVYGK